jgi:glycosyltransferase involved in cell wall biosynthesis
MSQPIRILQVVIEMAPTGGGVEVWLMQVLRQIDRDEFAIDFLVHTPEPKGFDDEIRSLGSRVLPCIRPLYLWKYPFEFRRVVRANGPYDVVHCHTLFSGLVTRVASWCGVPVRVAHSHSDVGGFAVDGDSLRGPVVRYTNRWARTHATHRLACSRRAGQALFGAGVDWRVLHYGIDLAPFESPLDRAAVRAELGLPAEAFVVGHVGRFQEQKNHRFVVEIAAQLAKREPAFRLLLVGDGQLRPAVERQVAEAGLGEHVRFLGVRRDVPRLLRGAMDVFLLPSFYEGLPLVGIEAQAAGLPCVLSDTITDELDVGAGLLCRRALAQPAAEWAEAVLAARSVTTRTSRAAARDAVQRSPFNLQNTVRQLEDFYRGCEARARVPLGTVRAP